LVSPYRRVAKAIDEGVKNPPDKAIELVRLRRIIKLISGSGKIIYIALGTTGDYLLIPKLFCTCKDFELNVVIRRTKGTCYHLIALELALKSNSFRELRVNDDTLNDIIYEILFSGRSVTLRKKLLGIT